MAFAVGKSFLFLLLWLATLVVLSLHYELSLPAVWQLALSSLDSVGALLVVMVLWRCVDRRAVRELFSRSAHWGRCLSRSALLALLLSLCSIGLMYALDAFRIEGATGTPWLVVVGLLSLAPSAFFEEVAFRGYLFSVWQRAAGTPWAVAVTALIFALVHGMGSDLTWVSCATIYLAGVLLAYVRLRADVWAAAMFHFVWNAVQTAVGFSQSGVGLPGFVSLELTGHRWLSGGDFGVEGSVCTLIMLSLAVSWLSLRPRRDCRLLP